ncbi:MAG: M56 family metallopeptidase, partial [Hyphomonadaceae bacterium]
MSAVSLIVAAGALLLAPWLWSGLIAGARRAALGWRAREPAGDRGEKAVLAIMLAPVFLGAALLMAPPALGPASAPPPLLDLIEWSGLAPQEALEARPIGLDWPLAIALAVWALYGLGVLRFAAPLLAAHVRVGHVLRRATPDAQRANVLLSDLTTTPLAVSRGRIVVPPTLLAALSAEQIDMIVAHERRHHERGDIVYYALLAWLEVAFWFNPFVRGQINTCRLAAELDCDASVTRVAPQMRRTYAQTLLEVLKHTAGSALPCA